MFYKIVSVIFLISQSQACLELVVQSLNEIFCPIIEIHENRKEKFQNVNELTKYYKKGGNGHWILKNPYLRGIERADSEILNKQIIRSVFDHLEAKSMLGKHHTVGDLSSTEENLTPLEAFAEPSLNGNNLIIDKSNGYYSIFEDNHFSNPIYEKSLDVEHDDKEEAENKFNLDDENVEHYNSGRSSFLDFLIRRLEMIQEREPTEIIISEPKHVIPKKVNINESFYQ